MKTVHFEENGLIVELDEFSVLIPEILISVINSGWLDDYACALVLSGWPSIHWGGRSPNKACIPETILGIYFNACQWCLQVF